jgi:hypothetical protein
MSGNILTNWKAIVSHKGSYSIGLEINIEAKDDEAWRIMDLEIRFT